MRFDEVTSTIIALSEMDLTFPARGKAILESLNLCTREEVLHHLDFAGVIPECFGHDSSEEKLFAKYCDALLARAWAELGMKAEVIVERADAADVVATMDGYRLVGDAKAFRLSRTAKNQKDFKVEALNTWRKGADYACLVCPYYQYPNSSSQIYLQASQYNVTLLSYAHLVFLLRHPPKNTRAFEPLWQVGSNRKPTKDASTYWQAIQEVILEITGQPHQAWTDALEKSFSALPKLAGEQILFWETEKAKIDLLTHEEAKEALITALKIDSKIEVIRKNFQEAEASKETFES